MCLDLSGQRHPMGKVQSPNRYVQGGSVALGSEWSAASHEKSSKSKKKKGHRRMSREDERGLGGLDPSGASNLSLKSKN